MTRGSKAPAGESAKKPSRAERKAARNKAREQKLRARAEKKAAAEEKAAAKLKARAERQRARRAAYAVIRKKLANPPAGFGYRNSGVLPRVEITLRGDCQTAAEKLTAAGIRLTDLSCGGGKGAFKIRKKDLHKAVAILDEMCYNYRIGESFGVTRSAAFIPARIGLFVGAAAAAIALDIAYSYIWQVRVTGLEKLSPEAAMSALGELGIAPGRSKRSLDLGAAVAAINGIDGIADASVEVVGTTLFVNVLESTDEAVRPQYAGYVSAFDATVTRAVMRRGTSLVKAGDVVKTGDALADGSVYSTAGELLYVGECDGDIYGNIAVTYTVMLAPTRIEYRRTGRIARRTSVRLFGREALAAKPPFGSYESSASSANYDVLLPITVTSHIYYETEPVEVACDARELADEYAARVKEELGFWGARLTHTVSVKPAAAGMYEVHLFLSGEALLSRGVTAAESGNH